MALAARRVERLRELEARIEAAGGDAGAYALDVTDVAAIEATVEQVRRDFGAIDILVNNSGVSVTKTLLDHDERDYDVVMNTNLKGVFFVAQAVAKQMIADGRPGRIINIASAGGLRPLARIGIYCVSKAGVIHLTKAMAIEWGRHGINVNALCPGYIETEINSDYFRTEAGRRLIDTLPRKRVGKPEDLDALLLMLASEASHFVNGAAIAADDGLAAG